MASTYDTLECSEFTGLTNLSDVALVAELANQRNAGFPSPGRVSTCGQGWPWRTPRGRPGGRAPARFRPTLAIRRECTSRRVFCPAQGIGRDRTSRRSRCVPVESERPTAGGASLAVGHKSSNVDALPDADPESYEPEPATPG